MNIIIDKINKYIMQIYKKLGGSLIYAIGTVILVIFSFIPYLFSISKVDEYTVKKNLIFYLTTLLIVPVFAIILALITKSKSILVIGVATLVLAGIVVFIGSIIGNFKLF